MAEGLKESVLSNPPRGRFKARPYYSATGDFLAFHWSREDFYAHRENDLLTIYLSMLTHKPVGCKIKGVNRVIMDKLATFFSSVAKTPPTLGSLVLASRGAGETGCRPYRIQIFRRGWRSDKGCFIGHRRA